MPALTFGVANFSRIKSLNESGRPRLMKGAMVSIDAKSEVPTNPPIAIPFQYNPGDKTDHKMVKYIITTIPGHAYPLIYYSSGAERRIEFKLILNAYESGYEKSNLRLRIPGFSGVKSDIAKLQSFLYPILSINESPYYSTVEAPYEGIGAGLPTTKINLKSLFVNPGGPKTTDTEHQFQTPPACLFVWGVMVLKCIVDDITIKETMFNEWLDPVRAEATVKLIVDERSKINSAEAFQRRTLSTLGLLNTNLGGILPDLSEVGIV